MTYTRVPNARVRCKVTMTAREAQRIADIFTRAAEDARGQATECAPGAAASWRRQERKARALATQFRAIALQALNGFTGSIDLA